MLQEKKSKRGAWIALACVAALLALVIVLENTLQPTSMLFTVLKKGAVYAVVAASLNLLNGFTGLFSLGQAGFMLLGAYIYAVLTIPVADRAGVYQYYDGGLIQFSLPWPLALVLAGLAAALFAYLIGLPVLRLRSDYLAIATLGFAEILRAICQWDKLGPITNGSNILRDYPRFSAMSAGSISLSTLAPVVIASICILFIVLLINSSYGRAFKAIREDEVAAEAMGINLFRHKQLAFCISSFFAGSGGAMYAMFSGSVQAALFRSSMTYELLLIVVIGGIGSVTGSVLASFLYIACSEWWLRGLDSGSFLGIEAPGIFRSGFRLVVFSVIIMIFVLFFRRGIMGNRELPDLFRRRPKSGKEASK